jgi:hypothetical protein
VVGQLVLIMTIMPIRPQIINTTVIIVVMVIAVLLSKDIDTGKIMFSAALVVAVNTHKFLYSCPVDLSECWQRLTANKLNSMFR